jgi:hypothetical protein
LRVTGRLLVGLAIVYERKVKLLVTEGSQLTFQVKNSFFAPTDKKINLEKQCAKFDSITLPDAKPSDNFETDAFADFAFEESGEMVPNLTFSDKRDVSSFSMTPRAERDDFEQGGVFGGETGINLDEILQDAPNDYNFEGDGEIQGAQTLDNKNEVSPFRCKRIRIVDDETQIPFEAMREGIKDPSNILAKRPIFCVQTNLISTDLNNLQNCIFSVSNLSAPLLKKIKRDPKEFAPKTDKMDVEIPRSDEIPDFALDAPDFEIQYDPAPAIPDEFNVSFMPTPKKKEKTEKFFDSCKLSLSESSTVLFSDLVSRNTKSQMARKFYQLLVLINGEKIIANQKEAYGDIRLSAGDKFD